MPPHVLVGVGSQSPTNQLKKDQLKGDAGKGSDCSDRQRRPWRPIYSGVITAVALYNDEGCYETHTLTSGAAEHTLNTSQSNIMSRCGATASGCCREGKHPTPIFVLKWPRLSLVGFYVLPKLLANSGQRCGDTARFCQSPSTGESTARTTSAAKLFAVEQWRRVDASG